MPQRWAGFHQSASGINTNMSKRVLNPLTPIPKLSISEEQEQIVNYIGQDFNIVCDCSAGIV